MMSKHKKMPGPAPAPPHRHLLSPERDFRWRAGEITRLEAFCDVVFGFAVTLLVVSLEVPHSYGELMSAMRGFAPFAVCFAMLVMIWFSHYRFSRRYGLQDSYTVFLNVVLLFLVLFYVYPLKFLFVMLFGQITGTYKGGMTDHQASLLMQVYGAGLASVFTLFVLMYHHAYRLRRELELDPLEVLETRKTMQESAGMACIGLASFLVAFRNPAIAGWMYFLIGVFFAVHGTIMGKRKRRLIEKRTGNRSESGR